MRTLLLVLASASSAAYAQHTDAVARATVALEVRDKAVERCAELVRQKAPKSELKKLRIHQPYTLLLTGTVISQKGEIVTTALHPKAKLRIRVRFFDGSTQEARLVGTDPRSNIALVRVDGRVRHFVHLDEAGIAKRDKLHIVGHERGRFVDFEGVVTQIDIPVALPDLYGVNEGRPLKLGGVFMMATPIRRATPGSAAVDSAGRFVGILIGALPPGGGAAPLAAPYQLAFVIPVPRIRYVVERLRKKGRVVRSYYGVSLLPIDRAVRGQFPDLPRCASAVAKVEPGTPAEAAGLRKYDVVLAVNGKTYAQTYAMGVAMGEIDPGSEVVLSVLRRGKKMRLEVTPRER